ncbi:MAG: 30S ribosomal protein S4 [Candidatus Doudnabacteria bacterium RIFCSPHIGHO2_01_FULL_50_11]|uniref:Small ribosomal subunit protein uS4 n=1 Tax=Candidatus Doudnabacteria bacterium RIFCSPHIGHO2_01_FULL_50_11 TaxID=1817828 RepID=A0A1F5PE56_9BACT|nr:MAG: 30S ribosomal protein S4 [Candidatus Doudnabacteria bacterium RIFCSPHIGHO2_01_FULL_50_11]
MARHTGPKSRMSRRVGTRLFPKDEKIFTKRNFPPGIHGAASRRRISGYGHQLLEKQKAKWMYGVLEKQFRGYYKKAAKKHGQTGSILLQLLETRLDNTVFRLGFATTRPQARQLVSHGFIEVNGKKVSIPSYQVKVGDQISIRESKAKSKNIENLKTIILKAQPPEWLQLDPRALSGRVLSVPARETLDATINPQLIIEHYSR